MELYDGLGYLFLINEDQTLESEPLWREAPTGSGYLGCSAWGSAGDRCTHPAMLTHPLLMQDLSSLLIWFWETCDCLSAWGTPPIHAVAFTFWNQSLLKWLFGKSC